MRAWVAAIAVFVGVASAWAGDTPPADPADANPERIAALIVQLGDPQYAVRKRAQEELIKLGSEAFDALVEAESHADPEVGMQAAYLVRQIRSQWTRDTDPRPIQAIFKDYDVQSDERRALRIKQLAELPGDQGLEWLCRLVRFEKSPVLSKQAALAIIGLPEPVDQAALERRAATIQQGLKRVRRPGAQWVEAALQADGDPAGALAKWSALTAAERATLEQSPQETQSQIVLDLLKRQVALLDRLGRGNETEEILRQMVLCERGDSQSLGDLIGYLVNRKAFGVIDQLATRFAASFEVDAILTYTLCDARLAQGDKQRADQTAAKALEISGDSQQEHTQLGNRLSERGLPTWAEYEWQHAIKLGPLGTQWDIIARKLLSNSLHDRQQDERAGEVLAQLIDAAEKDSAVANRIRTAQQQQPRMDISLPALKSDMLFYQAVSAAAQDNAARQRELLERSLDQKRSNVESLIALYALVPEGDPKRAELAKWVKDFVEQCRTRIEEDPEDPSFYNQIAWVVANTEGDLDEAVRLSQKSIDLSRALGDSESRLGGLLDTLAHCYFAKGDYEAAVKTQEAALKADPHTASIGRALARFREALAKQQSK